MDIRNERTNVLGGEAEVKHMLSSYFYRMTPVKPIQLGSTAEWEERRLMVRKDVLRCLGLDPLPPRPPLNARYGGSLDREDYALRRVYFQTWPGLYASGWLSTPKSPGRHPAVLNPHGHWQDGARNAIVQSRCITLAERGYVALAVDMDHVDPAGFLIGMNSCGVSTWNLIRAMDLLVSLPEVDPESIGCTGASGGGIQTLYLMALDDRLSAAVPVAGPSYYQRILQPEYEHCTCNYYPRIFQYADELDMLAIFAPKPALYLTVTGDWTSKFPTEEMPDLARVYRLYDAEDRLDCVQWDCGHDNSRPMRERMYAWFDKWLKGIDYPSAVLEPELQVESVETLKSLDACPAEALGYDALHSYYLKEFSFKSPDPRTPDEWQEYLSSLRTDLADLLGDVPVKGEVVRTAGDANVVDRRAEKLVVRSEPEILLPMLLIGGDGEGKRPAALVIHPEGKKAVVERSPELLRQLLEDGITVAIPDVRLRGELTPIPAPEIFPEPEVAARRARNGWEVAGLMWGRPEAGMAVTDIRACIDVLSEREDVDPARVALIQVGGPGQPPDDPWQLSGGMGAIALFAGALEPRLSVVAIDDVGRTYLSGGTAGWIGNILRLADLPQIAAAAAPRTLLAWGATDEFKFAKKAYTDLNMSDKISLSGETAATAVLAAAVVDVLRSSTL